MFVLWKLQNLSQSNKHLPLLTIEVGLQRNVTSGNPCRPLKGNLSVDGDKPPTVCNLCRMLSSTKRSEIFVYPNL